MRYDDFSHLNHQIAALSIRRLTMLRHFSLKLIWSRSYTVSEDILPSGLSSNWSPLWREISKNFSFTCRFIDPRWEVSEADSSLLRSHARGGRRERWLATELLTLRTRSTICIASKGKTCHRRQPTGSRFQTWTTIQIYSNGTCSWELRGDRDRFRTYESQFFWSRTNVKFDKYPSSCRSKSTEVSWKLDDTLSPWKNFSKSSERTTWVVALKMLLKPRINLQHITNRCTLLLGRD